MRVETQAKVIVCTSVQKIILFSFFFTDFDDTRDTNIFEQHIILYQDSINCFTHTNDCDLGSWDTKTNLFEKMIDTRVFKKTPELN